MAYMRHTMFTHAARLLVHGHPSPDEAENEEKLKEDQHV